MKAGMKFYFWLLLVFSKFYILCANKKKVLWEKTALFCYSHPMALDKLQKPWKGWARCKMKRPNGQTRPGQVRSGQARPCKVIWIWKYIYNIQHAIQKLPTKFCVNRAIEPRVITLGSRARSNYCRYANRLRAFSLFFCTLKPVFQKALGCLPFFLTHSMVMFYKWSAPNIVDFRGGENI